MEQIDEKKNSEELVGLINSGTKDIFNKREVASRLGEDVANRIKDGLEEKKDEKRRKLLHLRVKYGSMKKY